MTGQVGDQEVHVYRQTPALHLGAPRIRASEGGRGRRLDGWAASPVHQAGEFDAVVGVVRAGDFASQGEPRRNRSFTHADPAGTVWLRRTTPSRRCNIRSVRQAFNAAIDKNAIIKIALAGVGTPANAWLPPGIPEMSTRSTAARPFNAGEGACPHREGGLPGREGIPVGRARLRINYGEYAQVYELIQAQLEKNLGIKVGLKELPINAFNNKLASPKTRPLLWGYTFGFDYPDAQELDQYLGITGAPYNYEGYSNKRYDALVAKANAGSNQKLRAQLYAKQKPSVSRTLHSSSLFL